MEITERVTLIFRAEFFNVFNRVVYGAPASNVSLARFGVVSSQYNAPRHGDYRAGDADLPRRILQRVQPRGIRRTGIERQPRKFRRGEQPVQRAAARPDGVAAGVLTRGASCPACRAESRLGFSWFGPDRLPGFGMRALVLSEEKKEKPRRLSAQQPDRPRHEIS